MTNGNNGTSNPATEKKMCAGARKLRDTYQIKHGAPLFQKEFGFLSLEALDARDSETKLREDIPFLQGILEKYGGK